MPARWITVVPVRRSEKVPGHAGKPVRPGHHKIPVANCPPFPGAHFGRRVNDRPGTSSPLDIAAYKRPDRPGETMTPSVASHRSVSRSLAALFGRQTHILGPLTKLLSYFHTDDPRRRDASDDDERFILGEENSAVPDVGVDANAADKVQVGNKRAILPECFFPRGRCTIVTVANLAVVRLHTKLPPSRE